MAALNADKFINNMLGEVIYQIVNGHEAAPADQKKDLKEQLPFKNENFFTWCTPGIPVTSDDFSFLKGLRQPLDPEKFKEMSDTEKETARGDAAYQSTMAMDNFSMLVDTVPSKSGLTESLLVWEPQERISHIYESILNGCEVEDIPVSTETAARIEKLRADIAEKEEAYFQYMAAYLKEQTDYVNLMARANTGSATDVDTASRLGPTQYKLVTGAYQRWESRGFKSAYEKMNADLEQLEGVSMSLLISQYREKLRQSQRASLLDGTTYSVARLVPAGFFDSAGWTEFSFSSSQLQKTDLSKTQKYSGGARYGIFGGAKGSYEQVDKTNSIDFDGVEIKFELCQVPIFTNGIVKALFTNNQWRLKTAQPEGSTLRPEDMISNGDPNNPQGKLFAWPSVLIFARNISITKRHYDKVATEASKNGAGGGGFSIGPFSMGAKASYNTSEKTMEIKQEGSAMVNKGTIIIGMRHHIVDKCPNPRPDITKWI